MSARFWGIMAVGLTIASCDGDKRGGAPAPLAVAKTATASAPPPAKAAAGDAKVQPAAGGAVAKPAGAGAAATAAPPAQAKAPDPRASDPELDRWFLGRHEETAALPEAMQKRIRYQLREVSKAPIALRSFIQIPGDNGASEVIAIYEFSAYEDCVKQYRTRKEARDACLPELENVTDHSDGESKTRKVRLNRSCRKYGVAYASFAAPAASEDPAASEAGGALKVVSVPMPHAECELTSLEDFFVADVDRDGRRELVLNSMSSNEVIEDQRRGQAVVNRQERTLWVIELGEVLVEQLSLPVARYQLQWQRVFWRDLNRDERPDLVQIEDCNRDTQFEEDPCPEELLTRTWYLYNRELDRWVDDAEKARPAPAAPPATPPPPAAPPTPPAPGAEGAP